jgi:3-hydroxybutyryl-CoA dehydrogenase
MKAVVVGAGTMGHGIAQVAAMTGLSVTLTDADAGAVQRAVERIAANLAESVRRNTMTDAAASEALVRIHTTPHPERALGDADVVIEAVVEDLEVKRRLFTDLDEAVKPDAILATNTSCLSVAAIADAAGRPGRVVGMHFFNPVHLMGLVEIVTHPRADAAVVERARLLAVSMGKTPIVVRDSPGFASSRLGLALGLEAMRMVEEGVASPEDIDTAMTLGYGHPMGPLKVTDLVGLDVRLKIAEYLGRELDDRRFNPPEILRRKVRDGELGKKTGKGFYRWPEQ